MDKTLISNLEELLMEERDRLKKEIEGMAVRNPEGGDDSYETVKPEYSDSPDDTSLEVADYEHNAALESELEKELKEVDAALVRIERGKYGICEVCGNDISEDRLRALPYARMHIECMDQK